MSELQDVLAQLQRGQLPDAQQALLLAEIPIPRCWQISRASGAISRTVTLSAIRARYSFR